MHARRTTRHPTLTGLAITALAMAVVAGCSDSNDTNDSDGAGATTAPASTEGTTTTVAPDDMATNIESLSYLMQGLLTTAQIGGGWVDMGRVVVPPSQEPQTGPLCPDGVALAEPIGTAMNAQVHTKFQRYDVNQTMDPAGTDGTAVNPSLTGGSVGETLLWNERQRVDAAFAASKAATEACFGQEWTDPDMGDVLMAGFDAPDIGTDSFTSGYSPVTPPASDPWVETQGITVLMSDPSSPVSLVFTVSMTMVHNNPDREVPAIDTAELIRIAEAASARIQDGM